LVRAERCGFGAGALSATNDVVVEELDIGTPEGDASGEAARPKPRGIAGDVPAFLGAGPHLGATEARAGAAVILAVDASLEGLASRVAANRAASTILGARRAVFVALASTIATPRAIATVFGASEAALASVGVAHLVAARLTVPAVRPARRAVFAEITIANAVAAPNAGAAVLGAGLTVLAFRIANVVAATLADAAVLGASAAVFTSWIAHAVAARRRPDDDLGIAELSLSAHRFTPDCVGHRLRSISRASIGRCAFARFGGSGIASRAAH